MHWLKNKNDKSDIIKAYIEGMQKQPYHYFQARINDEDVIKLSIDTSTLELRKEDKLHMKSEKYATASFYIGRVLIHAGTHNIRWKYGLITLPTKDMHDVESVKHSVSTIISAMFFTSMDNPLHQEAWLNMAQTLSSLPKAEEERLDRHLVLFRIIFRIYEIVSGKIHVDIQKFQKHAKIEVYKILLSTYGLDSNNVIPIRVVDFLMQLNAIFDFMYEQEEVGFVIEKDNESRPFVIVKKDEKYVRVPTTHKFYKEYELMKKLSK